MILNGVDEIVFAFTVGTQSSKSTFTEYVVFCKVQANVREAWSACAGSKLIIAGFEIGVTLSLFKYCIHKVEKLKSKMSGSVAT